MYNSRIGQERRCCGPARLEPDHCGSVSNQEPGREFMVKCPESVVHHRSHVDVDLITGPVLLKAAAGEGLCGGWDQVAC